MHWMQRIRSPTHRKQYIFKDPGIVVHGVALKPGKPRCLAVTSGKPVVIQCSTMPIAAKARQSKLRQTAGLCS
jgi:molybdopterin biosynthesis enzyme